MSLSSYSQYEQEEVVTNKPLAIGDGFFTALNEANSEAFANFLKIFAFKAFHLNW